jgi:hypothetical protein
VREKGVEIGEECESVKYLKFVVVEKKHGRNGYEEEDSEVWGLGRRVGVETNQ